MSLASNAFNNASLAMQTMILHRLVLLLSIYIKFFVEIVNFVTIMHFSIDQLVAHQTIACS